MKYRILLFRSLRTELERDAFIAFLEDLLGGAKVTKGAENMDITLPDTINLFELGFVLGDCYVSSKDSEGNFYDPKQYTVPRLANELYSFGLLAENNTNAKPFK